MNFKLDYLTNKLNFHIVKRTFNKINIDELRYNLFSYFESYKKMGFIFINIPNELIWLSDDVNTYSLFGECFLGYFVISNESIFLICNDDGYEVFHERIIWVNSSLEKFLSSYSIFLSKIFILKSMYYKIEDGESEKIAKAFINYIMTLDYDISSKYLFWNHIAYLIEDEGIVLRDDVLAYVNFS